ncbi:MAG: GH3 auxin-responsive promoter family protein [Oscillospiraceae bacterium]
MSTSQLTMTGEINAKSQEAGLITYQAFQEMVKDPMKYQQELLFKLLEDNKDTEYGKKYGFSEITSIKEFQEKLPITKFDNYAEYITRMTQHGESNLITVYPVNHYNRSAGTMGTPKCIPVSDPAAQLFFKYSRNYFDGMIADKIGSEWINGKNVSIVECFDAIDTLPCGASSGAVSAKMMLDARPYWGLLVTSPDEAVFPQASTFTRYLHARFAIMEQNVAQLSSSFSSYLYELMRYIENNWELLVSDIANGTISESISLHPNARKTLMERIKPMPERAAQLREIFEQGFEKPIATKIWPNLTFIVAVGTGVFQSYMDKLRTRYVGEEVPCYYLGLTASEGTFSVPFQLSNPSSVLIPESMFFEFLPVDAEDDFSKVLTIDQLEQGGMYEVIITNLSGFYRYRMGDVMRVVGMHHSTPIMEYVQRLDNAVSMMCEKTSETAIRFAAEETAKELGFELAGFSMYPDSDSVPSCYQYFLEISHMPKIINPKIIRLCLEKNLVKANPVAGQVMKNGMLGTPRVNFLEKDSYNLYADLMIFKGAPPSQIKPVTVIHNEVQRKFFFGRTEYSSIKMQ